MDTYGSWIDLKNEVFNCLNCEHSAKNRLFDCGNRSARIMIVGDCPNDEDSKNGRLFSAAAGEYIFKTLELLDLDKDSVYLTNLIKCNIKKTLPLKKEDSVECIKYLRRQFLLVKPEIVICLGEYVSKILISEDFLLYKMHGRIISKGKTMFMGTYHPDSFFNDTLKRDCFLGDMAEIKEFCNTYPPLD